jgi:hypothetical protein
MNGSSIDTGTKRRVIKVEEKGEKNKTGLDFLLK